MSTSDHVAAASSEPQDVAPVEAEQVAEPTVVTTEREVTLERGVRVGRVMIGFTVLGVVLAVVASLIFPVAQGANYTLGQIVGFMALIGAAFGLVIGGIVVMILSAVAKKQRGTGVAIQANVQ